MKSQNALDLIRNKLVNELRLTPLDVATRTKAQYFRTVRGRVFGLLLGDLRADGFAYPTVDLLFEPCNLPYELQRFAELVLQPYRGSSTHAPSKGVFLKDAQTRIRVDSELALRKVLSWYANQLIVPDKSTVSPMPNIQGISTIKPTALISEPEKPKQLRQEPPTRPRLALGRHEVPGKGLLISDPWIEQILRGEKVWEMRSRGTNQRGWIALIKAGSGFVYGIARIEDCLGKLSDTQMLANHDKHGIPVERLGEVPNYRYAWVLADVQRLPKPVPYQHPFGAVIFANLDESAQAAIGAQLQN